MILTVTLNASVDKLYMVESLKPDTVIRVKEVSNTAGGKGLNVSRVAALAGERVCATGFLGGFNGRYVCSLLGEQGVEPRFCMVDGETRSCINIRDLTTGKHTEFLEPGFTVSPEHLEELLETFKEILPQCNVVTISGSVPSGTPGDYYGKLINLAKEAGKPVLLDTSGELLQKAVKQKPTLIKPNADEMVQLIGVEATSRGQIIAAAKKLHSDGIGYVVVSLGRNGSLLVCGEGIFQGITPDVPVVNTVGCGDSMIAGFAVAFARGYSIEKTLAFATAISTANALTVQTGYFLRDDLRWLLDVVKIKRLG